jgi:hypothetical protein
MDSPTGPSILLPRCPFAFPPCRFFSATVQSKDRAQLQSELHEPAGVGHQVPDGLVCAEPHCPRCQPGRRRLVEDRPPSYQLRRGVRGGCAVVGRSSSQGRVRKKTTTRHGPDNVLCIARLGMTQCINIVHFTHAIQIAFSCRICIFRVGLSLTSHHEITTLIREKRLPSAAIKRSAKNYPCRYFKNHPPAIMNKLTFCIWITPGHMCMYIALSISKKSTQNT